LAASSLVRSHDEAKIIAAAQLSMDLQAASVVIWTTTPWTIPQNRAVAFNPTIAYGLYKVTAAADENWAKVGDTYLLADRLGTTLRFDIEEIAGRPGDRLDPEWSPRGPVIASPPDPIFTVVNTGCSIRGEDDVALLVRLPLAAGEGTAAQPPELERHLRPRSRELCPGVVEDSHRQAGPPVRRHHRAWSTPARRSIARTGWHAVAIGSDGSRNLGGTSNADGLMEQVGDSTSSRRSRRRARQKERPAPAQLETGAAHPRHVTTPHHSQTAPLRTNIGVVAERDHRARP
jgi:hypothetical protein